MVNKKLLNSRATAENNSYRFKKLACTLAAVALSFSCAASLSGCNNKNNTAAKSQEPSVSETTTTKSKNIFDSEAGDAGLNLKTVHSDALEMDITIPEGAESIYTRSADIDDYFDDGTAGKEAGEGYIWEKDGIYYQYEVSRYIFEKCPEKLLDMHNRFMDEHKKDSDGTKSMVDGDIVAIYPSDWSAGMARKFDNDCIAYAVINASGEINDKSNQKAVNFNYYDTQGANESEKDQMRPVIKTMMNKTIESLKAIK